jgi:superfamily II DNA or RNA helicase
VQWAQLTRGSALVWGTGDLALQAQVRERQRITIENYGNDPDLLAEHVGMEDNFQAGGYGERQIEELLQNAIDQLTRPGRVELRLADGVLYCANEGSPFAADGIKAVTGAFLSSKKDEKIGRFGLGFKSVLGVTEQPQIISQTISFGFNEAEARDLLAALPYLPPRVPTLRVPSVLDADAIAVEDPNIAEMMTWASTIVKLPLVRGGDRLRKRLTDFDARYLLFPERLAQVDITLDSAAGRMTRTFRRVAGSDPDLVQLESPDADPATWRVLHRDHQVSGPVTAALPGLFHRERVRVSYALPVGQGRREDGEFWAWFPLLDRTTAQGLFNAPWQVNDDRTSLLPGSALNHELLEIAAELLIDAALLESTAADPAKHFDILPARGRESRSNADSYMSERIPQLARKHELIPTASGQMRSPSMVRAPCFQEAEGRMGFGLPSEAVRRWNETAPAGDTPHWSCYSTTTRAARLRQLLTDEDDRPLCKLLSPAGWLSELAAIRTEDAIDGALSVFLRLQEEKEEMRIQFKSALIIPLEDGSMVRAADGPSVLLPVEGADAPEGVKLVDARFAADPAIRQKLDLLGVREISPDQIVAAAAASVHQNWSDDDWARFWRLLSKASMVAGRAALENVISRRIDVKVPTRASTWRAAGQVFLDPASVPGLPERQPDLGGVVGRSDLLEAAGCLKDLRDDYPVHIEKSFAKWLDAMQKEADVAVANEYGDNTKGILRPGDYVGIGPVDVLLELRESKDPAARDKRAFWTSRVLRLLPFHQVKVQIEFVNAAPKSADMKPPETWAAEAFGLLDTTLGPVRISKVLASSLDLYGEMLPVARDSYSGIYPLPADLTKAPAIALASFLERGNYGISDGDRLAEVLAVAAARKEFAGIREIPALDVKAGLIELTPPANVVIATLEDLDDLATHGLRYIPSGLGDDILIRAWGLQRAVDVVAKSIDWTAAEESVALVDVYPTLAQSVEDLPEDILLRRCTSIVRRTTSSLGVKEQPLLVHIDGRTVLVDSQLDLVDGLLKVSSALRLNLTHDDATTVVWRDEELGKSKLVQQVLAEPSEQGKLLMLVGRHQLAENLPHGLLEIIEERQGSLADREVAELFFSTYGYDALRRLKDALGSAWRKPPRSWDGTPEIEQYVTALGFPRAYGGTREHKAAPVELVPGKVELSPLHDFQLALREQIRELVLIRDKEGDHRRGLLYLPTGAGKTRVTTESITAMLRDEELGSPVLWIAQSEELCEQAIVSWTEVWRAIGDKRPLEITRYWGDYEADESLQELQVVVATDAKLAAMIERGSQAHRWLQDAKLVVIDEAHTAGSPRYTAILRWLGITRDAGRSRTGRPLLGLTATPYRGTNVEVNKQFVARFGERRLNALDETDPIGQLREMKVLSRVEHRLLDGIVVNDSPTEGLTGGKAWDDISRSILAKLGDNLDRTQMLVDHIMDQDADWPILVFTPSVVSAHVTAALLRSLGRPAEAVDGEMRGQERRRKIEAFKAGGTSVLVNCDLLTQGFDAPKVRALYIARPTFSPNRYVQMVGRGLRGPMNGGTAECLVVNMVDTFTQFDKDLAYTEFDYLWTKNGTRAK